MLNVTVTKNFEVNVDNVVEEIIYGDYSLKDLIGDEVPIFTEEQTEILFEDLFKEDKINLLTEIQKRLNRYFEREISEIEESA